MALIMGAGMAHASSLDQVISSIRLRDAVCANCEFFGVQFGNALVPGAELYRVSTTDFFPHPEWLAAIEDEKVYVFELSQLSVWNEWIRKQKVDLSTSNLSKHDQWLSMFLLAHRSTSRLIPVSAGKLFSPKRVKDAWQGSFRSRDAFGWIKNWNVTYNDKGEVLALEEFTP
ncbi:MAG: hypothetical protein R3A11_08120 [Bdellovibrionota bacterium]